MTLIQDVAFYLNKSIIEEFKDELNEDTESWLYGFLHLYTFHNTISEFRGVDADITMIDMKQHLAAVHKGDVYYSYDGVPYYSFDDILYIIAHETAHIERGDDVENRMEKIRLPISIGLFLLFTYIILPLVVLIPIIDKLVYYAIRRHAETDTDFRTLEYISLWIVLDNITSREPKSRFGWLLYDHATFNKFARLYKRKGL